MGDSRCSERILPAVSGGNNEQTEGPARQPLQTAVGMRGERCWAHSTADRHAVRDKNA